jgi:transposase
MDVTALPIPDDVEALKAALKMALAKAGEAQDKAASAQQKHLDVAAELAVAKAMASEDKALIAHQALRIAKLERQVYGPRKERSAQLQDQMELELEEHEASATQDEIAAELAVAKTTRPWRASFATAPSLAPPFQIICPGSASCWPPRRRASAAAEAGFASSART